MRVALVHDALVNRGGGERVALALAAAFPGAPLHTSVYLPDSTFTEFRDLPVVPLPALRHIRSEGALKRQFPAVIAGMRRLALREFDVVISNSTYAAKWARVERPGVHIGYCQAPFRLAWSPESYMTPRTGPLAALGLRVTGALLRPADRWATRRLDRVLANSKGMQRRLESVYGVPVGVLYPPVETEGYPRMARGEHYLVVSRLEPYKRVDLAIAACERLGRRLIVVGDGTLLDEYRARASSRIEFLGPVPDAELRRVYGSARALLFPQREDFGIVPVESVAAGTPVIAYGAGGATETMVPWDPAQPGEHATAVFFHEQTVDALAGAMLQFEQLHFDVEQLQSHAHQFGIQRFVSQVRAIAEAVWDEGRRGKRVSSLSVASV